MHRTWIAMLALLLTHGAAQAASQRTVSFPVEGQKVVGTLELPEGSARSPVILLLH